MELSAALTSHVHDLSMSVTEDAAPDTLGALAADLERAVPSYLGLQLVLYDSGHEVTLTAFDPTSTPDLIATSLQVTLSALGVPGAEPSSSITLYAATPGAFVDLAADIAYAANLNHELVLDQHLATRPVSGITGTRKLSVINIAIGILIDHGHTVDHAPQELQRLALTHGLDTHQMADRLVTESASYP